MSKLWVRFVRGNRPETCYSVEEVDDLLDSLWRTASYDDMETLVYERNEVRVTQRRLRSDIIAAKQEHKRLKAKFQNERAALRRKRRVDRWLLEDRWFLEQQEQRKAEEASARITYADDNRRRIQAARVALGLAPTGPLTIGDDE